ncbi:MAG: hypothetical protein HYY64_00845 [Candidatus Rokubacteria bacterium]|nr:hypothetical protein [Candidatus Rokubacteria bacterium]
MTLTLSREEHEFLMQALRIYLDNLRVEIARTDSRSFRAQLRQQEEIAQALVERLSGLVPSM